MSDGIFAEPGAMSPDSVVDNRLSEITANALSSMDEAPAPAETSAEVDAPDAHEVSDTPDPPAGDTDPAAVEAPVETLGLDPEKSYTLPDGTTMTGRQILDGQLRQSDYTKGKQALALEREQLAEMHARLKEREESQSSDSQLLSKINALRHKSAEAREELSALIEAYGDAATAAEIKSDPEIAELKSKIATLESAREDAVRSQQVNDTRQKVDKVFGDLSKKYPYADQGEAEALVIAGKFDRFEDAVRHSHSRVEVILQKKTTEKIKAADTAQSRKAVVPTRPVSTAATPQNLNPLLSGSVFDSEANAARAEYFSNMKELNI